MVPKLLLFLCIILLNGVESLNLNPLTPFHHTEKKQNDKQQVKEKTEHVVNVKEPVKDQAVEEGKSGEDLEVKEKKKTLIDHPAEDDSAGDDLKVKSTLKEHEQKDTFKVKDEKKDDTLNANTASASEEKKPVEGKKVVFSPGSLFARSQEEENKPFVQPEHHIMSNKKCQNKETPGCCEGYIDFVSNNLFGFLFHAYAVYMRSTYCHHSQLT